MSSIRRSRHSSSSPLTPPLILIFSFGRGWLVRGMVDHGYMFDSYEPSGVTPWTVSYDGAHRRLYECETTTDSSLKSVPYSAMDSNSYQSLLSLRSSTIPPRDVASLRAFSTTVSSSVLSSLASQSSIGRSTVSSTASRACGPVLSTPMPIFCLQSRRKREAEFFQAEYLPVEMWRADRLLATWAPPSDQPYHEIECLRVSRGRHLAALVTSSLIDSTSDCTPHSLSSSAASAAPTWTRVADEPTITTPTTTTDYESTTVVATDAIEEEWARNVDALSRELDGWSTTSSSVVSPLSSDLSSIDLSFPTMTTACSLDAWDCETQNGEETDPPVPSKSMLRGVYEILAAIFCSRRKTKEEEEVKKVEIKMDRGYDGKR